LVYGLSILRNSEFLSCQNNYSIHCTYICYRLSRRFARV